jgi:hypothetical protein
MRSTRRWRESPDRSQQLVRSQAALNMVRPKGRTMRLDWHPDKSRVVDLQHKPIPYRQSEAIKEWGGRYGARPNFERRIHQARPISSPMTDASFTMAQLAALVTVWPPREAASRAPKASASSSSLERCGTA